MNKEFFKVNRQRFMEEVEDNSLLVLFAGKAPQKSGDESYPFTPNRSFYYLTGIDKDRVILIMTKINDKVEENLFILKADLIKEKWVGKTITLGEAKEASGIDTISYVEEFDGVVHRALVNTYINKLYLNLEREDWTSPISQSQIYAKAIIENYPNVRILNAFPIISALRTIKTEEELNEIREAIRITQEGIKGAMRNAKPGMMEYEIEAHFDYILKCSGVKDFAFKTIAAAGKNATVLHYSANECVANDGDLILMDLGAQINYYNADITRTFPVNGKFTERQKQIYNIVLKAQLETIKVIKAGIPFKEINATTRRVLLEELTKIGACVDDKELSNYYFHGVSHYLGLDTHDVGSRDMKLVPGMVLTVEPGLYIAEEGIGIRIEDNVLVTADGSELLSKDIIKTVDEIEAFMNR